MAYIMGVSFLCRHSIALVIHNVLNMKMPKKKYFTGSSGTFTSKTPFKPANITGIKLHIKCPTNDRLKHPKLVIN